MIAKERVIELGNRLGFEIVRICSADPFTDYEQIVKQRVRMGFYPEELVSHEKVLKNVETYADPSNSLSEAKSIISMAFCYSTSEPTDLTKKGEPHGVLARAYQRDVYGEMFRRREKFAEFLRKKGIKVAGKSRVPHKMAAVRAGVGWQGKNSLIVTERFGSWITLNSLVIGAEFETDTPSTMNCGPCQACQCACPTSAIQAPGVINVNKCIDYLTCKTGSIPLELRKSMGNRLIRCDRCQEACPYNKPVKPAIKKIPQLNPEFRYSPALIPLLDISEESFRRHYLDCDFIDPRKEYLQRNVIVSLGNVGDPVAVPVLEEVLRNAEPLIIEHAKWTLGKLKEK